MKTEPFRKKLEEEKNKLESEMRNIGHKNPMVPNDWEAVSPETDGAEPDLIDQANIIVDRENNTAIFSDLEARYDSILSALSRIEKRTYGKCNVCGTVIEEARLSADPAATTCTLHL